MACEVPAKTEEYSGYAYKISRLFIVNVLRNFASGKILNGKGILWDANPSALARC